MPYTANCDIYAAVNEDGLNLIALHIMRQRPSLFNYATDSIAKQPELACGLIDRTKDVDHYNPGQLFTVTPPLPVLGAYAPAVNLGYAIQLRSAKVDFFPQSAIPLPAELNPPLQNQHFSAEVRICAGIDCPGQKLIDSIPPGAITNLFSDRADPPPPPLNPSPSKLNCFCFEVILIGHLAFLQRGTETFLIGMVDDIDIVGLKPESLEANLACYIKTTFNVVLRERTAIPLTTLSLDLANYLKNNLASLSVSLSPNPPVPNDPAVEDNQLKIFIDIKVGP
jgi:hypothetical protein